MDKFIVGGIAGITSQMIKSKLIGKDYHDDIGTLARSFVIGGAVTLVIEPKLRKLVKM